MIKTIKRKRDWYSSDNIYKRRLSSYYAYFLNILYYRQLAYAGIIIGKIFSKMPIIFSSRLKESLRLSTNMPLDIDVKIVVDQYKDHARAQFCNKERLTCEWIEKYYKKGDVIYDVGANIGAVSLVATSFLEKDCKVYAFEPMPTTFNMLFKNIMQNNYSVLKGVGKRLLQISGYISIIKESLGHNKLSNIQSLKDVDAILCDIVVEKKSVNKELDIDLSHIKKFSMSHALSAKWVSKNPNDCLKKSKNRSDLVIYNMSNLENDIYKKCYGALEGNIVHAGIPRHDNDWIDFLCKKTKLSNKAPPFDNYVFIIGKAASPYNTIERKRKALRDIYNIVCIKYKLKLVIKTHPKESLDGIDGKIYRDILGEENYGKIWSYSDRHPIVLGKKAVFTISFYSGVALDMLAINKPTIEYLNLEGLDLYDNSDSLRDKFGKPVFQFRYLELVLGVSSRSELESCVDSILNQKEETTALLYSKYKYYFEPFDAASKFVANDIYKKITFE